MGAGIIYAQEEIRKRVKDECGKPEGIGKTSKDIFNNTLEFYCAAHPKCECIVPNATLLATMVLQNPVYGKNLVYSADPNR